MCLTESPSLINRPMVFSDMAHKTGTALAEKLIPRLFLLVAGHRFVEQFRQGSSRSEDFTSPRPGAMEQRISDSRVAGLTRHPQSRV